MLRRLIVVPFINIYASPDDREPFDPSNPRHRLKDENLREKLGTPDAQNQLLTWLVKGAVAWYANGLGAQPPLLQEGLRDYIADNDTLGQFIADNCEVGPPITHNVNAAIFRQRYNETMIQRSRQQDLEAAMLKRSFLYKRKMLNGRLERVYEGLCML